MSDGSGSTCPRPPEDLLGRAGNTSPQLPPSPHTGVSGSSPSGGFLGDDGRRRRSGGVIGWSSEPFAVSASGRTECIALHLEHLQRIGGERCAALGSDPDGAMCRPGDRRRAVSPPDQAPARSRLERRAHPGCAGAELPREGESLLLHAERRLSRDQSRSTPSRAPKMMGLSASRRWARTRQRSIFWATSMSVCMGS